MASGLPPPPTRGAQGDFAWTAWYNQLYTLLSTTGSVAWSLINKAGSSIADLQNKDHALLTNILGGGGYHLSSVEYANLAKKYGSFRSVNTQTAAAINTAYAILHDTTTQSSGVATGIPTSRIVISKAGTYKIDTSVSFDKISASAASAWVWFRVNGVDVANSNSRVTMSGSDASIICTVPFIYAFNTNDYFEVMFAVNDTGVVVHYEAATAFAPAVPSILTTVHQLI